MAARPGTATMEHQPGILTQGWASPDMLPFVPQDGRITLACDTLPDVVHGAKLAQIHILDTHFDSADDRLHPAVAAMFRRVASEKEATPDSVAKRLPVVAGFQMLKSGAFRYPNPWVESGFDDFTIDGAYLEAMVRNFDRGQRMKHEPFVTYGHSWDLGAAPADAWIVSAEARKTGLYGEIKLLAPTVDAITDDRYRYFSATFHDDWPDEYGKLRGPTLLAGAITNFPFLRGMQQYQLASFSARLFTSEMRTMSKPNTPEPKKTASAQDPATTPDPATPATQATTPEARIAELEAQLATEKQARATAENDVAAFEASIAAVGREAASRVGNTEAEELRGLVRDAMGLSGGECRLPPSLKDALLPGFDADPVKTLADSPIFKGSKRVLRAHLAALPPVVTVGKPRQSTAAPGDGGGVSMATATTAGGDPVVINGQIELTDEQAKSRGFRDAAHFKACLDKNNRARAAWGGRPDGVDPKQLGGTPFSG